MITEWAPLSSYRSESDIRYTILGRVEEEVHGLSKQCNQCNQLCDQCNQLCVVSAMDYGKCSLW